MLAILREPQRDSFSVDKLARNPILTVDQLLKLKSVEEIPDCRAGQQKFGDLQSKKDKFLSVKEESSELKKRGGNLQSQIDSKSLVV